MRVPARLAGYLALGLTWALASGYLPAAIRRLPRLYKVIATIPTGPGARTGLFVPAWKSLFVAVPENAGRSVEIRRYSVD